MQAVDSKKKVVIFEPTHKIGKDTVKKAVELAKNKGAKVLYVRANDVACKRLKDQGASKPQLKKAKWLFLPEKCSKCKYANNPDCELQYVLICKEWDVLVITYHKLKALVHSEQYSETSKSFTG